jgi:hypothetical protein
MAPKAKASAPAHLVITGKVKGPPKISQDGSAVVVKKTLSDGATVEEKFPKRRVRGKQKQLKQLIPAEDVMRSIEEATSNARAEGGGCHQFTRKRNAWEGNGKGEQADSQGKGSHALPGWQSGGTEASPSQGNEKGTRGSPNQTAGNAGATQRATKLCSSYCPTHQRRAGHRHSMSLEEELRKTRRELQAAQRALQERRFARSMPTSSEITVQALTTVLNHSTPPALAEAQGDRARLAEQLRIARAQLRTAKNTYSELRYEVWRLAQAGLMGAEWPMDALENVVRAAEDSDDDDDWERRNG